LNRLHTAADIWEPWRERNLKWFAWIRGLIRAAKSLINAANVHHGRELILVYEQAVLLHNAASPGHTYQDQHERALRQFTGCEGQTPVALLDTNHLKERNDSVMEHARKAMDRAQRIHERCQELDIRVNDSLLLAAPIPNSETVRQPVPTEKGIEDHECNGEAIAQNIDANETYELTR
jgi:hypothetical protein